MADSVWLGFEGLELKAGMAHELFHAAFAYHECGGGLGQNPFGFSPSNCPHPDSLMANLGPGAR